MGEKSATATGHVYGYGPRLRLRLRTALTPTPTPTLFQSTVSSKQDIPLLVEHFLKRFRAQGRSQIDQIDTRALNTLLERSWPGNVRELKAVLERALIYANYHRRTCITNKDLGISNKLSTTSRIVMPKFPEDGLDLVQALARCELYYIEQVLKLTEGRKAQAASLLQLNDRFALRRRVKSIIQKYPELLVDFPIVKAAYVST